MSALLLDIVVLAVIAAFAWGASAFGLVRASTQLVSVLVAIALAMLLRVPLGSLVERVTPLSEDLSGLIAMLAVGTAAYLAVAALASYYVVWQPHEELWHLDRRLAMIPGALLGVAWCVLMVGTLVLLPSNGPVARAAIASYSGGLMIEHVPAGLRWLARSFPHYTQTLPKGSRGAVVTPIEQDLPLRGGDHARERTKLAGELLANINAYRQDKGLPRLTWNLEAASAARLHSTAMINDTFFDYEPPDGGLELEDRIKSALGTSIGYYDRFGTQIVWAHSVPNAYAALLADDDARELLSDENLTEVGIGAVDGGWFNGIMISIALLGRAEPDAPLTVTPGAAPDGGDAIGSNTDAGAGGTADSDTSVQPPPPTGEPAPPGSEPGDPSV